MEGRDYHFLESFIVKKVIHISRFSHEEATGVSRGS